MNGAAISGIWFAVYASSRGEGSLLDDGDGKGGSAVIAIFAVHRTVGIGDDLDRHLDDDVDHSIGIPGDSNIFCYGFVPNQFVYSIFSILSRSLGMGFWLTFGLLTAQTESSLAVIGGVRVLSSQLCLQLLLQLLQRSFLLMIDGAHAKASSGSDHIGDAVNQTLNLSRLALLR